MRWSRRLSPAMQAFILADAVLVLVLGLLLVQSLGGPRDTAGPDASTPGPSAPTSSSALPSATGTRASNAEFAMPSGNAACAMNQASVTCTIVSLTYVPEGADSCAGSIGHVVVLDAQGVRMPCTEESEPVMEAQGLPVLDYGFTASVGPWTCTSATDGVTCVDDATGVGFRLARAEFVELR